MRPQPVLQQALGLLDSMWAPERALFSYTATRRDDGSLAQEFNTDAGLRYTVNSLAGMEVASRAGLTKWDVEAATDAVLDRHRSQLHNVGDQGLMLASLAIGGRSDPALLAKAHAAASAEDQLATRTLQEVCWLLHGLTRQATLSGEVATKRAASDVFQLIERRYLDRDSLLPRHSLDWRRNRYVSFGGIAYFLQTLYEYGTAFSDEYALALFREGVGRIVSLQGRQGEWAWFYDRRTATIVDWYELYTVHQLSMAPLFLLPAAAIGVARAREALQSSVRWANGENELETPMVTWSPFFTYRSIRRASGASRGARLARAYAATVARRTASKCSPTELEVNQACRSYEIGWLVYSWARVADAEGTSMLDTELRPTSGAATA
jgi:hypothetical protein